MSCGQVSDARPAVGVAAPGANHATLLPDAYLEVIRRARVLAELRAELTALGVATGGMVVTRLQATLDLPGGPTVTCRGGWLSWPVPGSGRNLGSACAVHWAGDLAGVTGRLTRRVDP